VRFAGSDKRVGPGGSTEYMLILSYAPNGCLQDYLRAKKLDWATFCRMSLSVAKGLAHLHTDIHKGGKNIEYRLKMKLSPTYKYQKSYMLVSSAMRDSGKSQFTSDFVTRDYPQNRRIYFIGEGEIFGCSPLYCLVSDKIKPCVSHRDLNTRNILVKADLSCCICDLGFAMKLVGSKYYQNGEELNAETKSINDVSIAYYQFEYP